MTDRIRPAAGNSSSSSTTMWRRHSRSTATRCSRNARGIAGAQSGLTHPSFAERIDSVVVILGHSMACLQTGQHLENRLGLRSTGAAERGSPPHQQRSGYLRVEITQRRGQDIAIRQRELVGSNHRRLPMDGQEIILRGIGQGELLGTVAIEEDATYPVIATT